MVVLFSLPPQVQLCPISHVLSLLLPVDGGRGSTIDLMKIDAEGAEVAVLLGFTDKLWGRVNQV